MEPVLAVAIGAAVIHLCWGGFCLFQGERGSLLLWRFVLPVGWIAPLCLLTYIIGRRRLLSDLSERAVISVRGPVYRGQLVTDFESNMPEPDQYVTSDALKGRFVIPLEFWKQMPEYQVTDLEVFKHSKIVFRINGQNAWEHRQQGQAG